MLLHFMTRRRKSWVAEKDDFEIAVGGSSRDLRLKDHFQLPETTLEK